jgi:hypothetical protein
MLETVALELWKATGERKNCTLAFPGQPPWFIEFHQPELGDRRFEADDLFEALCQLRLFLERPENGAWSILCNGARRDAYPSRVAREMSGGKKLYLLTMGKKAALEDLVYIFDQAAPEQVGTVEQQFSTYRKWMES